MKVDGNDIKTGNVIDYQGGLWQVVKTAHVKPGKGGAFAQIELKNVVDGRKLNERFRSGEKVNLARLNQDDCQLLYRDGDDLFLMNDQTFEQINVAEKLLGDNSALLQEGGKVTVESHEGSVIGLSLPLQISVTVVTTDAHIKGQTASSSYKPAEIDCGLRVMVPPFVQEGDGIVVSSVDLTYVKRVAG